MNAPICHGAGITHGTPNDRVREIQYVDSNGRVQSISDPAKLKAAAAAFGLLGEYFLFFSQNLLMVRDSLIKRLGVVTHLTFELDKMTYAMEQPLKLAAMLAVPPPTGWDVPPALQGDYTPEQLASALTEFIQKATDSYYCEWFWFAFQPQVWVNCWYASLR